MAEEKKYHVNVNRPEPTAEEIKKFKNFNSVISKHREITKRPTYKKKRTYFLILLILLVVFVIYLSEKDKNEKKKGLPQTEQTPQKSDR